MRSFLFCSSMAAALVLSIACTGPTPASNVTKSPVNAASAPSPQPSVADGKELFALHCMICHKETGKGGKVTVKGKNLNPEDLTNAKMRGKTDERLAKYITDGVPDEGMPAFIDELTEAQIKLVVGHVRSLQAK